MTDKVVDVSDKHVPFIAAAARQADMDECWLLYAITISDAIKISLIHTDYAKTWIVNGLPGAIGGFSNINGNGLVWAVGTDLVDMYPRRFIARMYIEFENAQTKFDTLYNYVSVRNRRYIEWLSWMGFTMYEPEPYGIFHKPFCKFEWRKAA